jgi:DNA-binding transcriptional LysR family regulator
VRKFRALYPGVKLTLQELSPTQQEVAFDQGLIDVGFTRTLSPEQSKTFSSRVLYSDPIMAVLPRSKRVKNERVRIGDLATESLIVFHREGSPSLFDTITGMFNRAGFSARVENEPNMMQTVLSLVEAGQGVGIVPACVRNLRSDKVRFYRLRPDDVRVELVVAWKKESPSVVLRAFLELIDPIAKQLRRKVELH